MPLGPVDLSPAITTSATAAFYRPHGRSASSAYKFCRPPGASAQSVVLTASSKSRHVSNNDVLVSELLERFTLLSGLSSGWDGPNSASPTLGALMGMLGLGNLIVDNNQFVPHALNITPAATGEVCFTLFGNNGREAELWVGDQPGSVSFVLSDEGDELREGTIPVAEYRSIATWLDIGDESGLVAHLNNGP